VVTLTIQTVRRSRPRVSPNMQHSCGGLFLGHTNRKRTMNTKQVQTLRNKINAAWAANDRATADSLQAELHKHFAAQADKFVSSAAGRAHISNLMSRA